MPEWLVKSSFDNVTTLFSILLSFVFGFITYRRFYRSTAIEDHKAARDLAEEKAQAAERKYHLQKSKTADVSKILLDTQKRLVEITKQRDDLQQ